MWNQIPHPKSSPSWNLSKNTQRYVENTNKKSSFLLGQICQFNHYGWLILLKFYWFLNFNSQNLLLVRFLIRPILDPKFPLILESFHEIWMNIVLAKIVAWSYIYAYEFAIMNIPYEMFLTIQLMHLTCRKDCVQSPRRKSDDSSRNTPRWRIIWRYFQRKKEVSDTM